MYIDEGTELTNDGTHHKVAIVEPSFFFHVRFLDDSLGSSEDFKFELSLVDKSQCSHESRETAGCILGIFAKLDEIFVVDTIGISVSFFDGNTVELTKKFLAKGSRRLDPVFAASFDTLS